MLDSQRTHSGHEDLNGPSLQSRHSAARRAAVTGLAPACLVTGLNERRRDLLTAAATGAGWEVDDCDNAAGAQRQVLLEPRQMVVVDLETADGTAPEPLKALCERLSRHKDILLVLCGNASNAIEEIWARQLGAWLYLPGVVEESDLSSLFEEAAEIARRRHALSRQQAYFPSPNAATA